MSPDVVDLLFGLHALLAWAAFSMLRWLSRPDALLPRPPSEVTPVGWRTRGGEVAPS